MNSATVSQLADLLNAGRYAAVESQARELLIFEPDAGVVWQLLGAALAAQGKEAVQALSAAVRMLPKDAAAHNNLANAFARVGKLEAAVASYRHALHLNPQMVEAHNNLAHALIDLGQFSDALECCRRAIDLKPGFAEAHDNHGSALLALGRLHDAQASYQRAIALDPGFAEAYNNLGNTLQQRGQTEQAASSYRRALELNPHFAEAHNNLGNTFRSVGQLQQALLSYDRALQINPRFAEAYCNRAIALRLGGHTEQAQADCRAALKIDSRSATAVMVLAEAAADRGEFASAEDLFKQAIALLPESPEAWAGLARLRKMTSADTAWLSHARRIVNNQLPPLKEITLRYALGKYFDDTQDFDQAFAEFRRANELTRLCRSAHDRQELTRTVDFITRRYHQKWLSEMRLAAPQSARPVFIVGMLRSGTTLAEQILAAHPHVFGAGELAFWSLGFERHRAYGGDAQGAILRELAAEYRRQLLEISKQALRVVDKMPTNFAFLGLIHAAMPHARIIHMQRNPLDTCLSIYFQHFETTVSYANDLDDLAHYYSEYLRMMNHWRNTLPQNTMLEVPYESLVADAESWTRRMLEFVDLPWDPQCLKFQKVDRAVITASKWQVRQEINNASVERWRNYRKFLGPLWTLLDERPLPTAD